VIGGDEDRYAGVVAGKVGKETLLAQIVQLVLAREALARADRDSPTRSRVVRPRVIAVLFAFVVWALAGPPALANALVWRSRC
jgi:cation transport ATPase